MWKRRGIRRRNGGREEEVGGETVEEMRMWRGKQ